VKQAVRQLDELMEKVLAETGTTEDEFVSFFDLGKSFPDETR
jgi:hypothetical protein